MNRNIKKLTLLLSIIVFGGNVLAQPKPWTFGENVVISPNLYTGTMQLAIPFYTYKDADFEIPVNFAYSSSGCVANVRGGIMGPGWGVNVGGMITREIRGIPDEGCVSRADGAEYDNVYGFYKLHKRNANESTSTLLNKLFRVFGFGDFRCTERSPDYLSPTIVYSPNGNVRYAPKPVNEYLYDAEPDIFHFNFMGYSGTFHLGFNDSIHIYNTNIDSKNFKIEIETNVYHSVCNRLLSINICTSDGYKYIFNCDKLSPSVSYYKFTYIYCADLDDKYTLSSTWNLTKIIAPNGRTVTFDYERKKIISCTPAGFYSTGTYYSHVYGYDRYNSDLYIESQNINKVINDREHFFSEDEYHMSVLKTITVNDVSNTAVAEIKFNHYTPATGNKDQYIGALNTASLKEINDESVLLSSIIVYNKMNNTTTKLKECNLTYMQNTNGARTSYLKDITIQGDGTYTMAYHYWNNSEHPYPANGTFSVDHWGYYNGYNNDNRTNREFLAISYLNTALDETLTSNYYRNHNPQYAKCGMLSQITYPAGGRYTFEYERHDYSKAVKRLSTNNFIPKIVNEQSTCGGLRVKTISNYSNNNNSSLLLTKNYVYKNNDDTNSGILLNMPRYYIKYSANLTGTDRNDNNMQFRSSDLTEFNNIHIEYAMVREIQNDGSHIRYSFTNSTMPGYMDTVTYISVPEKTYHNGYKTWSVNNSNYTHTTLNNIVAPVSSKQFMRGRLLRTDVFSNTTTPLTYTETNDYYNEYTNSQTYLPHYYVRALGHMPVYTGKYNLQSTTQTQHVNGVDISKTSSCTYNSHGQVASQTTTDSKGLTQIVEYKYVTDTATNPNGTRIIDLMAKHNVINLPLREEVFVVENGVKTLIGGRRYTYFNPVSSKPAMIRLQQVDTYDSETGTWITDAKYNVYDNYGNLLEQEDANGLKTSYIYGYNGLYKIAEINNCSFNQVKGISGLSGIQTTPLSGNLPTAAENSLRNIQQAEVTTFDYKPLIGLIKIKDSTGRSVSYTYNKHGKLEKVINTAGEPEIRYNYSTDNN
ncbi:MAG: hypothetical protein LBP63_03060 [Prevotellaceae bacterium]|jgi:hypothetical protein|nr:hypothetical protein [Prevotellaceae bacterium]